MNNDDLDRIVDEITNMTAEEFEAWLLLSEEEFTEWLHPPLNVDDYEHFIVFYTDDGISVCVFHMVGYSEFPTDVDVIALKNELRNDESLGMTALVNFCSMKVVSREIAINIMEEDYSTWK